MTFSMNQIFYKCNKFDNIDSLQRIQQYMLTTDNLKKIMTSPEKDTIEIQKIAEPIVIPVPEPSPPQEPKPSILSPSPHKATERKPIQRTTPQEKSSIYFPQKHNSLFWCMFIRYNGYDEYVLLGKKYANREIEEKQKMIDSFKKNMQVLKFSNHKVTNAMTQEIVSEIMMNKKSSLLTCIAFSIYYKKHIYIVKNKTHIFYAYSRDMVWSENMDVNDYAILHYKSEDEYGIDMDVTLEKIIHIRDNTFCLESIEKPLKGVSSYKTNELEDIARKIDLKLEIALKKADLYQKLLEECTW